MQEAAERLRRIGEAHARVDCHGVREERSCNWCGIPGHLQSQCVRYQKWCKDNGVRSGQHTRVPLPPQQPPHAAGDGRGLRGNASGSGGSSSSSSSSTWNPQEWGDFTN